MKLNYLFLIIFGITSNLIKGQKGEITGNLLDTEFNDVLPFANVLVKNTSIGTTSDFEGKYVIILEPGVYTLIFSFIGYTTKEITEVVIKDNTTTEVNVSLSPLSNELEEVVVRAKTAQNTEASLLNVQKKSINLIDGISAQTFKKIGASNLATAIKTVPGVSIQGGKYVYVRGLGDRYTKSILNGVDIPGLDPDRNTIQMDIFPTNIIDNIQVVKSATANLPADFTGGMVNIVTKDFTNKEAYSISAGAEYNPKMHFNSNFLSSKGSKTDFLGFDNGSRELPINRAQYIPKPSDNNSLLSQITQTFNPEMKAKKQTSLMNYNFGFTAGNLFDIGNNKKLGYLASVTYKNEYIFYKNFENGNYRRSADKSVNELELDKNQKGDLGKNNVLLSALAGLTLKTEKSKYKLTVLHIQNGLSTAGYLEQQIVFSDAVTVFKDNIEYKQSQITNLLLSGKHSSESGNWLTEWKLSPTYSRIEDKGVRVTPFEYDEDTDVYSISPSSAGSPARIWRNLEEINAVAIIDEIFKHKLFKHQAKLLFGGNFTYKQRDFGIDSYNIRVRGNFDANFRGNADRLLEEENLWTVNTKKGSYIEGNFQPSNTFDAAQTIASLYVSEEFQISPKLKSIVGIRFEKFDMLYTGQNNRADIVLDNQKVLDKSDIFPSINIIYGLNEETNLRFSYAKTTARPSFKEASITQIFDPLSSTTFNGNIELQPTYVNNLDFRFEKFGSKAQMFAVSAFFKQFTDPIELTYFLSATDQFQPRNLGSALVYGAEFEMRKNFGFINDNLEDLSLKMNFSLIQSSLKMDAAELESRRLGLRDGEILKDTRVLQGQSPYLINIGLDYGNDLGWQLGLYFNTKGETLQVVGNGEVPDVYTMPFYSLNYVMNKSFGKNNNSNISFYIKNILDDNIESHFQSYKATDQIFYKVSEGRSFSLGYTYKF